MAAKPNEKVGISNLILRNHYRNRLHPMVRSSAAPYGYMLATWTSRAVLTSARGIPNTVPVLSFIIARLSVRS